jgi:hypothetical protein
MDRTQSKGNFHGMTTKRGARPNNQTLHEERKEDGAKLSLYIIKTKIYLYIMYYIYIMFLFLVYASQ